MNVEQVAQVLPNHHQKRPEALVVLEHLPVVVEEVEEDLLEEVLAMDAMAAYYFRQESEKEQVVERKYLLLPAV